MAQKANINPILILVLTVIVPLLAVARPVNASRGVVLRPPFAGIYRVTSYFDHQNPNYVGDSYIWIYNGERVPSSRANQTGEPYPYDGHDGWDFSMTTGTHVLAAAPGTVVVSTLDWGGANSCYGHTIVIDHGNNYYTQYSHLSDLLVNVQAVVVVGQHIANSGNSTGPTCSPIGPHLHFSVRHSGYVSWNYAIDPFGWRGSRRDPLYDFNQKESSCLWAGLPGDSISCTDFIVEDDGAGWSQYGAWFQSNAGNGFRQHWTYSWNPPDYWAKWTPTLPYQGYYQIHVFIPAENATTTNALFELHRLSGTTFIPVYENYGTNRWVSAGGTFYLQSPTEYLQLYDYTGEPNYSKQISADSVKFSASIVHLPYIRNSGGWVSSVIVRNNSGLEAQALVNYYNMSGGRASDTSKVIAGNATISVTPPSGHDGSAVVVADQDVSVVVENHSESLSYAYTGQSASTSPLYLPQILQNLNGVWHTNVRAMNTGVVITDITVNFYNPDGSTPPGGTTTVPNVPINGSSEIAQSMPDSNADYVGRMSAAQPVASVVRVSDSSNYRQLGYTGVPVADTTVWLPFVMTRLGNDWGATIWIQNTTSTGSTVNVDFYQSGVRSGGGSLPLAANGLATINLRTDYASYGLPAGWSGSARLTATVAMAAVVNQLNDSANLGASYEGIPNSSGSTTVILPDVVRRPPNSRCYYSNFTVRNLGSVAANVTITYYNEDGTSPVSVIDPGIASERIYNLYTSAPANLPDRFRGSVVIVSTNSQPIAATSNMLYYYYSSPECTGRDDTISYTGVNR